MSAYPVFNAFELARKADNKVVMYLTPNQPVPDMVPYELHEHIFPDDWHTRLTTIRDVAFRYYKPMFERVWIIFASLATIILPLALYQVIFDAMYKNQLPHTAEHFYTARLVSMAVFVGVFLLFWGPMFVWHAIGKRHLRKLVQGWEKVDRASKPPSEFVPVWRAQSPSVFKSTCVVTITVPPSAQPTIFHPNAYMPPYINAPPADSHNRGGPGGGGAPYYYPYAPGQAGLPRMSVAGTLPAYQSEPGKERYFEDVKV